MSYDPNMPDMPYMPDQPGGSAAAEKTNLPGILLIVVGAINILGALYMLGNGAYSVTNPEAAVKAAEQFGKSFEIPGMKKSSPDEVRMAGIGYIVVGLLSLAGCFLTIFGGIRMRQLQSYGLAMTGGITAAIPCISCLGCCGVGQIVGIWAIVVLMNEQVKRAFT
jgi:hypothetical protein